MDCWHGHFQPVSHSLTVGVIAYSKSAWKETAGRGPQRSHRSGLLNTVEAHACRGSGDGHGTCHPHTQLVVVLPAVPPFPGSRANLWHENRNATEKKKMRGENRWAPAPHQYRCYTLRRQNVWWPVPPPIGSSQRLRHRRAENKPQTMDRFNQSISVLGTASFTPLWWSGHICFAAVWPLGL